MPPEPTTDKNPPISKEAYAELVERLDKVQAKLGVKHHVSLKIVDSKADIAQVRMKEKPLGVEPVMALSTEVLLRLTPRELETVFAHEVEHVDSYFSKDRKKINDGTTQIEDKADDKSITKFGDLEAFISAQYKLGEIPAPEGKDRFIAAEADGVYGLTKKFEHAKSDKKRDKLLHKLDKHDAAQREMDPHSSDEARLAYYKELEAHPSPAMQERTEWSSKLDVMHQAAKELAAGGETPEAMQKNIDKLQQALGKDSIKFEPPLTANQAMALGERLLTDIGAARDEYRGHDFNSIGTLVQNAGKEAVTDQTVAQLKHDAMLAKVNALDESAHILVRTAQDKDVDALLNFRANLMLKQADREDIKIDPPLNAEEAKRVADKITVEAENVRQGKPGHTLEGMVDIIKNRGADAPQAVSINQNMHPKMQKALADYATSSGMKTEGNYLPSNKPPPDGKFIS